MGTRGPIAVLLAAALLAGCPAAPGGPPGAGKATPRPGPLAATPGRPGAGIISDGGGSLLSDNGGALTGKVKAPAGLIANHGAGLVANHGAGVVSNQGGTYRLHALDERALAGATLTIVDAADRPVPGPDGKPYTAVTDAAGAYRFARTPVGRALMLRVELVAAVGPMRAFLPDAKAGEPRAAEVDAASTLVMGYVVEKYVRPQADPAATLAKLPAAVAADTRARAAAALAGAAPPTAFKPADVVGAVEALRARDAGFDAQVREVERLLGAGLKDLGDGREATRVPLTSPMAVVRLADGAYLVAERNGHRIRRVAPDGTVTSFAGKLGALERGDGGPATQAWIDRPSAMALAPGGDLYVADFGNHLVRRIDAATGVITTVVGNGKEAEAARTLFALGRKDGKAATEVSFAFPDSLAIGADGRLVLHGGPDGVYRLRDDGTLQHLPATDGGNPIDLASGPDGGVWAIGDGTCYRLEGDRLVPAPGVPRAPEDEGCLAVGPDGALHLARGTRLWRWAPGEPAWVERPLGVEHGELAGVHAEPGGLVVCDIQLNRVWRLPDAGAPALVAGRLEPLSDGVPADELPLNRPLALTIDPQGRLLVADGFGAVIWRRRADGRFDRFAGTTEATATTTALGDGGPALKARFGKILGIAFAPDGRLLLAEAALPLFRMRAIAPDGTVSAFPLPEGLVAPAGVAVDAAGEVWIGDYGAKTLFQLTGGRAVPRTEPGMHVQPIVVAIAPDGTTYYGDAEASTIWRLPKGGGPAERIAGTTIGFAGDGGPAREARLNKPLGMAFDARGRLYLSDTRNDRVRRIDLPAPGMPITTIAGAGGRVYAGTTAEDSLKEPMGLAIDPAGNLWIADSAHNQIKAVAAKDLE